MRKLKRRLQQLFIASAVVGAGSVVACSAAENGVFTENQLDYSITIGIDTVFGTGDEEENFFETWRVMRRIEPGGKAIFTADQPGPFNATEAGVKLEDDQGNYWKFWIDTKSIERAGCVVQITDELIDFLNQNYEKTRKLTSDKLVIRDADLLHPEDGRRSYCDLTPYAITQTAQSG